MATRYGGNKYVTHAGGWNQYNINIGINISSLSWDEEIKAFNLSCEINKNGQAKTPGVPPRYLMVAP